MGFLRVICLPVLLVLCLCVFARAAPFPDSGNLYRQYRDDTLRQFPSSKDIPATEIEEQQEKVTIDDTHTIHVRGFNIIGCTQFTQDTIHQVLNPYIDRPLNTSQLHAAATALMKFYRSEGFFAAKVYLPPHSIHDGIVTLHVYEGHLEEDGIKLENSEERVHSDLIMDLLTNTIKPGLIRREDYERAILLVNDLPGISAQSILYPGHKVGTADFLMKIQDEDQFNGNLDYDNFGDYYTGEHRFGTTLYWHSPTKHGEETVFRYVTTGKYSNFGYLDAAVPVGHKDFRLGASVDYLKYELDHEFAEIDARGYAYSGRAYVTYPFVRSRYFNVHGSADYNYTRLVDEDIYGELADRALHTGIFRISGDHDDHFLSNGVSYFDGYLTVGNVDLSGNDNYKAFDESTADIAGGFAKINAKISRLQHLFGDFFTYAELSGQLTHKNLDSSQKFYLGGPYSVSGYPVGETSGDDGALFYADLRYNVYNVPWKGNLQLSTFYSCGWIDILHDPWEGWQGDNEIISNDVTLQSMGIAVSQTWQDTMVIRMMLGKQVGDHVTRNPVTGEAHDASDSEIRFWINTIFYF